jgi:hypothetical protein
LGGWLYGFLGWLCELRGGFLCFDAWTSGERQQQQQRISQQQSTTPLLNLCPIACNSQANYQV